MNIPFVSTAQFQYQPANSTGLAAIEMSRSIRTLLTTVNGVTRLVPEHYEQFDPSTGSGSLPAGMPTYGPVDVAQNIYPAQCVAAATGTKEQLWRAYWSAMTQNMVNGASSIVTGTADKFLFDVGVPPTAPTGEFNYNGAEVLLDPYRKTYDAFQPPDRYHSIAVDRSPLAPGETRPLERLTERQMVLIRSALAACNTIDLRDNDNDITAMTVDLGLAAQLYPGDPLTGTPAVTESTGPRDELYARVYGTEKQLVISAVVIDDPDGGTTPDAGTYVGVEIFNPTDEPIVLDGYRLVVVNRGDTPPPPGGAAIADGAIKIDDDGGTLINPDDTKLTVTGTPAGTTLAPGGFIVIDNATALPAGVTFTPILTPPTAYIDPNDPAYPTTPDPQPAALPPQRIAGRPMPFLKQLQGRDNASHLNRELVLLRTRRADGVEYNEDIPTAASSAMELSTTFRRPRMNEQTNNTTDPVAYLSTLVPVDAVDCRSLDVTVVPPPHQDPGPSAPPAGGQPQRYWYMRMTAPPARFTADADAWKIFYAGKNYDLRPGRVSTLPGAAATTAETGNPRQPFPTANLDPAEWAWRRYPDALTGYTIGQAVGELGVYRHLDPALPAPPPGMPRPFLAPTIPIQNAKPFTKFKMTQPAPAPPDTVSQYAPVAGEVDHPPFQYPYGSPFARNADVLQVPFIGTYKIYRVRIQGPRSAGSPPVPGFTFVAENSPSDPAPTRALYEFVPITMDAVNVAPDQNEFTSVTNPNPSVGRFDSRTNIWPRNDWAADLFEYVTARQSGGEDLAFPDIPNAATPTATAYFNNPLSPATDQDGPILSINDNPNAVVGPTSNLTAHVPWIDFRGDTGSPQTRTPTASKSRGGDAPLAKDATASGSQLIEGVMNLNTMPPVVLRMLPWTADPATGFVDQTPTIPTAAGGSNAIQRQSVGLITDWLDNPVPTAIPTTPGLHVHQIDKPPFGFTSALSVAEINTLDNLGATNTPRGQQLSESATPSYATNQQLMRLGMLNAQYRPNAVNDFNLTLLNANRVSNLASQRSDVFTVYVTVQAWTYVPRTGSAADQIKDTRLVGERRGSFVVDRSAISQTNFKPSDLIVYPVGQD